MTTRRAHISPSQHVAPAGDASTSGTSMRAADNPASAPRHFSESLKDLRRMAARPTHGIRFVDQPLRSPLGDLVNPRKSLRYLAGTGSPRHGGRQHRQAVPSGATSAACSAGGSNTAASRPFGSPVRADRRATRPWSAPTGRLTAARPGTPGAPADSPHWKGRPTWGSRPEAASRHTVSGLEQPQVGAKSPERPTSGQRALDQSPGRRTRPRFGVRRGGPARRDDRAAARHRRGEGLRLEGGRHRGRPRQTDTRIRRRPCRGVSTPCSRC